MSMRLAALAVAATLILGGCAQANEPTQAPTPTVPTATALWSGQAQVGQPVTTPDGVKVEVVKMQRFTIDRHWFDAGPAVAVTVTLTNGTRQAIDVHGVRVLLAYGATGLQAQGAFSNPDGGMGALFDGTVAADGNATAQYSFRVPAGLQQITVEVDLKDPVKAAAHFTGNIN